MKASSSRKRKSDDNKTDRKEDLEEEEELYLPIEIWMMIIARVCDADTRSDVRVNVVCKNFYRIWTSTVRAVSLLPLKDPSVFESPNAIVVPSHVRQRYLYSKRTPTLCDKTSPFKHPNAEGLVTAGYGSLIHLNIDLKILRLLWLHRVDMTPENLESISSGIFAVSKKLDTLILGSVFRLGCAEPVIENFCAKIPRSLRKIVIKDRNWIPYCPSKGIIRHLDRMETLTSLSLHDITQIYKLEPLTSQSLTRIHIAHSCAIDTREVFKSLPNLKIVKISKCCILVDPLYTLTCCTLDTIEIAECYIMGFSSEQDFLLNHGKSGKAKKFILRKNEYALEINIWVNIVRI